MKNPPLPTKHLEVKTYDHKGVSVRVEVNYDQGTISLLDKETGQAKKWLFAKRELEYMQGWQNILDAMKYAITKATEELTQHQEAQAKKKEDLMLAIAKEDLKNKK